MKTEELNPEVLKLTERIFGGLLAKVTVINAAKEIQQYIDEENREILNELISIKQYMEERNAFHGYGQMNDLITKLEEKQP